MKNLIRMLAVLSFFLSPVAIADVVSHVTNDSGRRHWVAASYDRTYCVLTHTSGGCGQWGTENFVTGWFEVAPGATKTFTGKTYVHVAISPGGGKDYIQMQQNSGTIITGDLRNFWAHPTKKFEYVWGRNQNGSFLKGVKVDGQNFPPRVNLSSESWVAFVQNAGMTSFKSIYSDYGTSRFSID